MKKCKYGVLLRNVRTYCEEKKIKRIKLFSLFSLFSVAVYVGYEYNDFALGAFILIMMLCIMFSLILISESILQKKRKEKIFILIITLRQMMSYLKLESL
ncbi:MAG: hypothetical protein ACRC0S_03965 [Fusobacteriaceae bacterium]